MIVIKNREKLIENGETKLNQKARALTLRSLEHALNSADPKQIMKSKVLLKNSSLQVDRYRFDLKKFKNIYVIGGGKASGSMAEALEQILGRYITSGLVNVPHGSKKSTKIIRLHEASHPVPDEAGVEGTRRMLEIAEQAEEDDLVMCLISGGGSSLMPMPRGEISIVHKRKLTNALLKCGATINEINTIRKHISDFKGGWLAKKAYPATILNLILSDVVGDPLDSIASGPTVPDSTTFNDAIKVLKKYSLWDKTPATIKKILLDGERSVISETPKVGDKAFKKAYNVVVGNNRFASLVACGQLRSEGLNTLLLTAVLEGEARHVGVMLASIAREICASGNPISKPASIVAGGETTVTVTGKGLGGRNQELSLASSLKLTEMEGVVLASLSTDGVDGPTDAAGAMVDGKTLAKAARFGLNPEEYLHENNSYEFFSDLGDLIFTGPTGTNVNDISIIVVL
ncbi:MAG: glycerate kinase [Candidatus Bathyarchaeota archaeon]|nr:glycerate kinase [Candidatus Bathyarchaeota archaeon]MDH5787701.1 glycerate kinase [Candidatus Bathyarchaeota archaeon]